MAKQKNQFSKKGHYSAKKYFIENQKNPFLDILYFHVMAKFRSSRSTGSGLE